MSSSAPFGPSCCSRERTFCLQDLGDQLANPRKLTGSSPLSPINEIPPNFITLYLPLYCLLFLFCPTCSAFQLSESSSQRIPFRRTGLLILFPFFRISGKYRMSLPPSGLFFFLPPHLPLVADFLPKRGNSAENSMIWLTVAKSPVLLPEETTP